MDNQVTRKRDNISPSGKAKLKLFRTIPVYPDQMSLGEMSYVLSVPYGKLCGLLSQLPTDLPLAQSGALFCWPTEEMKRIAISELKKSYQRKRNSR